MINEAKLVKGHLPWSDTGSNLRRENGRDVSSEGIGGEGCSFRRTCSLDQNRKG